MKNDRILLSHGSGGKLSHQLIKETLFPLLENPLLAPLDDGALIGLDHSQLVMTTDSYVVDPIFFSGGDIGKLAVSGTINDVAVMGAIPRYLSLSLIIEEGLPVADLQKILQSIQNTCRSADVQIVTGDTKVVPRGAMDKIFINTTGVGELSPRFKMSRKINLGDAVIINGTIGDHGTTVMAQREGLNLQGNLQSDCAPLNDLIRNLSDFGEQIRIMRDPTRGGLATTLNELAEGTELGIVIREEEIPVRKEVQGLCEILGLDPLYLANEGKVVIVAADSVAPQIVEKLRLHPLGKEARIIGRVEERHPNKVVLETQYGTHRIVDMLTGEQLPRIC